MIRLSLLVLFLFISAVTYGQSGLQQTRLDSITTLRNLALNQDYSATERLAYAQLAKRISDETRVDTTILKSSKILAGAYYDVGNFNLYRKSYFDIFDLSEKIKDTLSMAVSYQNLGWYHYVMSNSDSTYYYYLRARDLYKRSGNKLYEGETLINIADLQESLKDYLRSEENAVKAIEILQQIPMTENNLDNLWILNNLLGIISKDLKSYDQSIDYHQKALDLSRRQKSGRRNELFSLNNIALVYREMGDYETAVDYHLRVYNDPDFKEVSPSGYAVNMGNMAYTQFLSGNYDKDVVVDFLNTAYKECVALNFDEGVIALSEELANYYLITEQPDSAKFYAKKSYDYARDEEENEFVLNALKILSEVEKGETGRNYYEEYIQLSDSLLQQERTMRNKFARIEFETDQIIAENEQITRERLIFLLSSIALLVTLIMLYIIITQRIRNKELEFSKRQQEANEEIYNLMLAQQDKIDEGRTREKKRISEELHDGILGRLFGTRLSLDSLNFQNTEEAVKTRGQYIEELKSIEQEIRKISHDLNSDFISGSSFSNILKTLVETQTEAYKLTYSFEEDDEIDWDGLSNKVKIHVYRMLQECMQNVYKHANATHIKIVFELKNDVILLTVQDDGSGFNTNKARKGIGLKNFDSRASDMGGRVEIFSKPGQGTRVKIVVPAE